MNNDLQLHCSYFNINKNYLLKWFSLYYLESLDVIQHIVMLFKWLHSCLTFAGKFSCKSFTQKLCKSRTCQSCLCLRFTPQRILSIKGYYSLQQCSPADLKGLTDEREGKRKPGGGGGQRLNLFCASLHARCGMLVPHSILTSLGSWCCQAHFTDEGDKAQTVQSFA